MDNRDSKIEEIARARSRQPCWSGGRGKRGPLWLWMEQERVVITAARDRGPYVSWSDIAKSAEAAGVQNKSGGPYTADDVRTTWWRLSSERAASGSNAPRSAQTVTRLAKLRPTGTASGETRHRSKKVKRLKWLLKLLDPSAALAVSKPVQRHDAQVQSTAGAPSNGGRGLTGVDGPTVKRITANTMPPIRRFGDDS